MEKNNNHTYSCHIWRGKRKQNECSIEWLMNWQIGIMVECYGKMWRQSERLKWIKCQNFYFESTEWKKKLRNTDTSTMYHKLTDSKQLHMLIPHFDYFEVRSIHMNVHVHVYTHTQNALTHSEYGWIFRVSRHQACAHLTHFFEWQFTIHFTITNYMFVFNGFESNRTNRQRYHS